MLSKVGLAMIFANNLGQMQIGVVEVL